MGAAARRARATSHAAGSHGEGIDDLQTRVALCRGIALASPSPPPCVRLALASRAWSGSTAPTDSSLESRGAAPQFFHGLLVEWVHYIPVADNLANLADRISWAEAHPARAVQMGAAARLVADRLHAHEIACFWWQLLTALAPLENFEPRTDKRFLKAPPTASSAAQQQQQQQLVAGRPRRRRRSRRPA